MHLEEFATRRDVNYVDGGAFVDDRKHDDLRSTFDADLAQFDYECDLDVSTALDDYVGGVTSDDYDTHHLNNFYDYDLYDLYDNDLCFCVHFDHDVADDDSRTHHHDHHDDAALVLGEPDGRHSGDAPAGS